MSRKKTAWPGWHRVAARKPLAVCAVVFVSLVIIFHSWRGVDLPPRIADLLTVMIYVCVGGYAATSAYETVHAPQRHPPTPGEGDDSS